MRTTISLMLLALLAGCAGDDGYASWGNRGSEPEAASVQRPIKRNFGGDFDGSMRSRGPAGPKGPSKP